MKYEWVITLLPKFIGGIEYIFLYEKIVKLYLLILILFPFNLLFKLISSDWSCNPIYSAEVVSMGQGKMLSSANEIKRKNSNQLEKSIIKIRNKSGSSTEPSGTPWEIEQNYRIIDSRFHNIF